MNERKTWTNERKTWISSHSEAPMRAEFLQKRLISAFFGFQWQNLAEILHLFKKYNNIGKVAVKRVSWTDYALWTLGSLDALVKKIKLSLSQKRLFVSWICWCCNYTFFCRECCIYVLFCRECRDYALFDIEFYAEFLEEILRNTQNFGRNSAEKIGGWSLWPHPQIQPMIHLMHHHPGAKSIYDMLLS